MFLPMHIIDDVTIDIFLYCMSAYFLYIETDDYVLALLMPHTNLSVAVMHQCTEKQLRTIMMLIIHGSLFIWNQKWIEFFLHQDTVSKLLHITSLNSVGIKPCHRIKYSPWKPCWGTKTYVTKVCAGSVAHHQAVQCFYFICINLVHTFYFILFGMK